MSTKLFPCIMIVLNICAAVVFAYNRNWRMTAYWGAAAVLNISITF